MSTMSEISDAQLMTNLRRSLSLAAAKQVVSASNLANSSTPGFKAREVDFDAALGRQLDVQLTATRPGHLGVPAGGDAVRTREVDGQAARRDGNTVQADRELLNMTRASGEFARAQTALAAKFRLVRYALNEAR
jgi:flagellar basal-body rod protein FlgB